MADDKKVDDQKDDDEKDDIKIVESGDEVTVSGVGERDIKSGGEQKDAEGDDDADKVALGAAKDDAEKEKIREARRVERRQKAEERRVREEAQTRTIAELQEQVRTLSQGQSQMQEQSVAGHIQQLEGAITQTRAQIAEAREYRKTALKENQPDALDAADEALNIARVREQKLLDQYDRVTTWVEQQRRQQAQPRQAQMPPETIANIRAFSTKHSAWYDPLGRNEDSKVVIGIDAQLAQEGFDPRTATYWDELEKRAARRLPERFKAAAGSTGTGRQVTGGDSRDGAGGGESYKLPKELVDNIREAGMWDDEKARNRIIKRYMENQKERKSA